MTTLTKLSAHTALHLGLFVADMYPCVSLSLFSCLIRWHSRVASLGREGSNKVILERPLPVNISLDWNPTAYLYMKASMNHNGWSYV